MPQIDLSSVNPIEMIKGYHARFIHTENMTLNFLEVEAGAIVPEHSHPHEQVSIVTDGEFELTVAGEPMRFGPGKVIVIPSNVKHSGIAITDCKLLDVFNPVREDYRALSKKGA
ncbi:MAG: cupin domain-containing protein [Bacteroidota bacterium]